MKKEVKTKWQTEGDLAVIYNVDGILLFFSKDKDPRYFKGQLLTQEEAEKSGAYKAIKFVNMDSVPNDAFPDLNFAWNKS